MLLTFYIFIDTVTNKIRVGTRAWEQEVSGK